MRTLFLIFALFSSSVATPSLACMAANFGHDILIDEIPSQIPLEAVALRIQNDPTHVTKGGYDQIGFSVKVLGVIQGEYSGLSIMIQPSILSSCTRWGTRSPIAYAVGFIEKDSEGHIYLDPIPYTRPDENGQREISDSPRDRWPRR